MAFPDPEGEDAFVLDRIALDQIGHDLEGFIIDDQACIADHAQEPEVACTADQGADFSTVSSGFGGRLDRASGAPTVDRVKDVYRRAARAFEREPRVYDVLVQLQASRDADTAAVFAEFSRQQTAAFGDALADIPSPQREDIVAVMSAVLSEGLRGQQLGLVTFADVYSRLDRTADLILC